MSVEIRNTQERDSKTRVGGAVRRILGGVVVEIRNTQERDSKSRLPKYVLDILTELQRSVEIRNTQERDSKFSFYRFHN